MSKLGYIAFALAFGFIAWLTIPTMKQLFSHGSEGAHLEQELKEFMKK